jgi:PTH1 family peptidyl-tRNA hydrolase
MKIILGLGNPGRQYEATRHNVGWWLLDHLAGVWRMDGWRKDGDARVASGSVGAVRVRLVKPLTYMNLSGSVLRPYLRRETWEPARDLLVVVDDVALPLGRFRLRARGSHGGHNGLRSVEAALESREYARLRIGIGPPPERRGWDDDLADFVLAPLSRSERAVIAELREDLAAAAETWVRDGIEKAMNVFNRKRETEPND